jgi:hypothetical protein
MQHKKIVREMFMLSCQEETFYFFCVTGLNISQKLVMSLRNIPATHTTEQLIDLDTPLVKHLVKIKDAKAFKYAIGRLYFRCF